MPMAPQKALALALGRGALDELGLGLDVRALDLSVQGQAELLEEVEPLSLVAMLQGPQDALAVMVLDPAMLAGVLDIQTTGKVGQEAPEARRPTRTDAAMCAGLVDRVLTAFEAALDGAAPGWMRGFRYAGFLADPRPLALMLEDGGFHTFRARLDLGPGAREAGLLLAFPDTEAMDIAAAPACDPAVAAGVTAAPVAGGWGAALQQAVLEAPVQLEAVLARLRLPLSQAMTLRPGDILDLPDAALERMELQAGAGRVVARARLGQVRNHRALRLGAVEDMDETPPEAEPGAVAEPPAGGMPAPPGDTPDEATPDRLRQTG